MFSRAPKKSIPGIDNSLLAVFRVIAVMLWRDGSVESREEKWFKFLITRFEISTDQKRFLLEDLKKCPDLRDVFSSIDNQFDRDRLLSWLRTAMNIDGKCSDIESKLYREILSLNESTSDLAKNILAADNEIRNLENHQRFWTKLGKIGKRLGRMTPYGMFINAF